MRKNYDFSKSSGCLDARKLKKQEPRLDKEEKEILDAIESGAWKPVKPRESELKRYAAIARNTLRKGMPGCRSNRVQ